MNLADLVSQSDSVAHWSFGVVVRSTLLLLIAGIAAWAAHSHSAAGRHFLWCLGLVGILLVPIAAVFMPKLEWQVLPAFEQNLVAEETFEPSTLQPRHERPAVVATAQPLSKPKQIEMSGQNDAKFASGPESRGEHRSLFVNPVTTLLIIWASGAIETVGIDSLIVCAMSSDKTLPIGPWHERGP